MARDAGKMCITPIVKRSQGERGGEERKSGGVAFSFGDYEGASLLEGAA
jgi:hypothetical protein